MRIRDLLLLKLDYLKIFVIGLNLNKVVDVMLVYLYVYHIIRIYRVLFEAFAPLYGVYFMAYLHEIAYQSVAGVITKKAGRTAH